MQTQQLIARLEGVRQTGASRWIAKCPAHQDKTPSLSIRETDDGRVLLHCFGGCPVHDVVAAVGLELRDLMPASALADRAITVRDRGITGAEAMLLAENEIMLIAIAMRDWPRINEDHAPRIKEAVKRLHDLATGIK